MTEKRVSIRYARALLNIAVKESLTDLVLKDLQAINAMLDSSRELINFTNSPIIQYWKKKKVFSEIFEEKISKLTMGFLVLLLEKRRENLIPSIAVQYEEIYNKLNHLLPVQIESATSMSDSNKEQIETRLRELTKQTVIPRFSENASLKGGLKVRIDDWVFDATISNQLAQLHKQLIEGNKV
jgi:F-type H+-transporting ATPase subunit delta